MNKRTRMKITVLLMALLVGSAVISGCEKEISPPKFKDGQLVRIQITGETAMVVGRIFGQTYRGASDHQSWYYLCRVDRDKQVTQNGLFSKETTITAYTTLWFADYELEKIEDEVF